MGLKMDWSALFLFSLFIVGSLAQSQSYYTIVAPRIVRPNSEYHVAVSIVGVSTPTLTRVELTGQLDSGELFEASENVLVEPFATRVLKLDVGETGPGKYRLSAKGLSGYTFENSTDIDYVHKSYSVFIQTDRAIYKPGHTVQFRCIVLDSRLRPTTSRALDIYISDGQGNRIKQWSRPALHKGIFNGELELSRSPVFGDWEIVANVGDQTFRKGFQIAEYVLPKFEVKIVSPPHATFKEGVITVTVTAKYSYGKPVKGEATITAFPDIYSPVLQPVYQAPIRKIVNIDGGAVVQFDIVNDLKLADEYERPVIIEAAVEEALTGRRQNASIQITLHKHPYKMQLLKTAEFYKPGLKYTAFLKLAYHDGTPVRDKKNPVMIDYGFNYDQEESSRMTKMLDDQGMVELDFYPPVSQSEYRARPLRLNATYLNLHEWFTSANPAASPSESYIQAVLLTPFPKVNSFIEIEVNSTNPMKYLSYEILGRGDILNADSIQISNRKVASFRFLATYVMAPVAHVLVYYVRDDGEIVADSLDVELDGMLQNFVDVNVVPGEVEPGKTVDLSLLAKPNSYIGLLGVDQNSITLKSGNDLRAEQVREEVMSYNADNGPYYEDDLFSRSWMRPGSASAGEVFQKTGTVVLTNAYVHTHFEVRNDVNRVLGSPQGVSTLRPDIGPPVLHKVVTKPPWAGRYAFSYNPLPAWNRPRVFLMHDISNTWLFANISGGVDGKAIIRRKVPDTITSWVITAFSMDNVYGLGLIDAPRKLKVFKPFFISMDLPYSVIRGEIVAIPIQVFNYMNKDVTATVRLENNGDFEFAEISNEVHDAKPLKAYQTKEIFVEANSGKSVSFMIVPTKINFIKLKAKAESAMAGDTVEFTLPVKAEGETQYRNKVTFVDLRGSNTLKTNVTVDIPKNFVPDSDHVEVSAVGDILGPSIPNLANLIKMPYGCGEQNMLNFVPNIVILNYLKNTNQLTPAIQSKAIHYLEIGYQQELTYRHTDGSFSAFGNSDASGSTWLTAFVAKSFKDAEEYITVDKQIINEALQWLADKQAANGSFPEVGKVSHRDMQGGAAKGLALTAYVLTTFLEASDPEGRYRNVINNGVDYVARNVLDIDDLYALSICTYVLNLARNPAEDRAFTMLELKAMNKEDMRWWSKPVEKDTKNPWYELPRSVDVEMTSYAMMTYLRRNSVADATSIMKWLIKQRNQEGGFSSTQDTVVGIHALAKLGERLRSTTYDMSIKIEYGDQETKYINIRPDNAMILQSMVLPGNTRIVNITATGSGFAIVQVSSRYNLNVTGAFPLFTLDPQVDKISTADHLQLSICSAFLPTREANESNMAVMEIGLPSGFTVDADALPSLEASQHVKRVETKNGDTMVVLYFDKMVQEEYCPTVSAFRTHKVAKQKPVPVTVYDYYDSSRRARVFYEPKMTTLCDICEGENCGEVCITSVKLSGEEPTEQSIQSFSNRLRTDIVLITISLICLVFPLKYM